MDYADFIKRGNKVWCTWREYDYYSAICTGYGAIPHEENEEVVTIIGTPRDKHSCRYVSLSDYFDDEETEVLIRDKKGLEYYATLDMLSHYARICDLSFEDLVSLRKQICLGSIYLADYENSFGVGREEVCDHADYFGEYIGWKEELDTPENFANYVLGNCELIKGIDDNVA